MRKTIICILSFLLLMCTGCQGSGNTDLSRDNTETGKSKVDEAVVIRVYDNMSSVIGEAEGWMGKILSEELGIKVELVHESEKENADICIYMHTSYFEHMLEAEQLLEKEKILEWEEQLLSEHGKNITDYLQVQMDYVTELCNGMPCGFVGEAAIENLEQSVPAISKTGAIFTMNAKSENPEKAMDLLNWMVLPENMLTLTYGPKGLCWDIDEEGYYFLTEFGIKCCNDINTEIPEEYGGGTFLSGYMQISRSVWNLDAVNPNSKHGESFNYETWKLMQ